MLGSLEDVCYAESLASKAIASYYQSLNVPSSHRIDHFSSIFSECPYELSALGEGVEGEFDRFPLYRVDAFDCQTFVETVLALSWSRSFEEFFQKKCFISYAGQSIDYFHRAHFICLDWAHLLGDNQCLVNITKSSASKSLKSLLCASSVTIDRSAWFQRKSLEAIRLLDSTPVDGLDDALQDLHSRARTIAPQRSELVCIRGKDLLLLSESERRHVLASIPSGSVMQIIHTGNTFCDKSQTDVHVRHLGFIIHKDREVFFRHASSEIGCVTDELCEDYLRRCINRAPSMGIMIYQVLL
tara:strand:+ start:597 stop:1493 length:897 start_codon:yes stop_codon:yes gene_type:complete